MSANPETDLAVAVWFKSSHSGSNGACVEAALLPRGVALRDSKTAHSPTLRFDGDSFADFLRGVVVRSA